VRGYSKAGGPWYRGGKDFRSPETLSGGGKPSGAPENTFSRSGKIQGAPETLPGGQERLSGCGPGTLPEVHGTTCPERPERFPEVPGTVFGDIRNAFRRSRKIWSIRKRFRKAQGTTVSFEHPERFRRSGTIFSERPERFSRARTVFGASETLFGKVRTLTFGEYGTLSAVGPDFRSARTLSGGTEDGGEPRSRA